MLTKTFVCSTRTTCPRLKYKKLCELVSGDHLDPYLLRWLNCTTFKHKRLWSSGSGKGTAKAPPMDLRICTPCPFQPDTEKRDDLWTSLHTFDLRPHSNHLFIYKMQHSLVCNKTDKSAIKFWAILCMFLVTDFQLRRLVVGFSWNNL